MRKVFSGCHTQTLTELSLSSIIKKTKGGRKVEIPSYAQRIIDRLLQNGHEAYVVGGSLRDILIGRTPYDFDVTTSATPEVVLSLFLI